MNRALRLAVRPAHQKLAIAILVFEQTAAAANLARVAALKLGRRHSKPVGDCP